MLVSDAIVMILVTQFLKQLAGPGSSPVHLVAGLRGSPGDGHVGVSLIWVVVPIAHLIHTTLQ